MDPQARSVTWVRDLDSMGDTCFPDAVPDGDHAFLLYNYSNDPTLPELSWIEGQQQSTHVYRQVIRFPTD